MKMAMLFTFRNFSLIALVVFHLFFANVIEGHRILVPVTSSFHTPSHVKLITTMSRALVERGHHVTLLRWAGWQNYPNGSASEVIIFRGCFETETESLEYNAWLSEQLTVFGSSFWGLMENVQEIRRGFYRCCNDLFADETILHRLNTENFDLVLLFYLSTCNGLLATYLDIPSVVLTSTVRVPGMDESVFGMPLPSSYVPYDVFSTRTDKMGFVDRLGNLFRYNADSIANLYLFNSMQPIQDEFDIKPEYNQKELFSGALLWLSHIDVTLDYARPFTPNVIPIGGILIAPTKPISEELAEFVDQSGDHGVVICSLGSTVKALGERESTIMLKTFNKLKQRVIWKFEGALPNIPVADHVRVVKWMPQNDLLAHPKVRVLIYHGGINGVYEAIYHGIPMVLLPLFADQFFTSTRIQDKGMGRMLHVPDLTEQLFHSTIETVISDENFKKNADRLSAIYRDLNRVQSPLERAIYWIEHVLVYGGDHLRPRSADMGTIELYMIDVIAFLILVSTIFTVASLMILRKCCSFCCRLCWKRRSSESKKPKSE